MTGATDITYFNLALGFLLMAIPIAIFAYYKTGLVKSTIISVVRMTIQLFLVGFYLKYVFAWDKWWLNLLWGIVMMVVAAITIGNRSNMKRSLFIFPIFTALLISMIIVDGFFIGIVIKLDNVFAAMYFIPITGMILGNCLRSNVIALNSFYKTLNKDRTMYRFYIANGATREEALRPFMRESLRISFNPTIANTAVIGLISLPGMMTGQLLGGSTPDIAIKYQIMLVITIFVASIITVFLTIKIVNRFVFDKYDRLKAHLFNFK
ncbi:MAG: ABC transporter permease [Bacteroidales bacterium]|nr:ABC transporter permease [Bacteroidales bacterium]